MRRRFVVVGSGRSGTGFIAAILQAAGVHCGHEKVYTLRALMQRRKPDWSQYEADVSWAAVPYLIHSRLNAVLVTRHPLSVTHSMMRLYYHGTDAPKSKQRIAQIMYDFRPEIKRESTNHDRCLAQWLLWNNAALPYVHTVLRLEDLTKDATPLLRACGVSGTVDTRSIGQINAKDDKKIYVCPRPEWNDFRAPLAREARRLATSLGYE